MPLDMLAVLNGTEDLTTLAQTRTVPHHSDAILRLEKRWKNFCTEFMPSLTAANRTFTRIPKPSEIQAFLLYLTRNVIKGKLDVKGTTTTIETHWHQLERLIRHYFNHRYLGDQRGQIRQFIRNALVSEESLSTKGRPKSLANTQTTVDLLHFLWVLDTKDLGPGRARLQLSLAILIMIFTGMRPGEFVESSNYEGSNEGILYKDLSFVIGYDDDGSRIYGCMVRIRNRKWARGDKKKA